MYLDWVASIVGVIGCYYVGRGKRYGWLIFATSSAINIYNGYAAGMLGLSAGCLCYLMLELKGFYMHHRKDK